MKKGLIAALAVAGILLMVSCQNSVLARATGSSGGQLTLTVNPGNIPVAGKAAKTILPNNATISSYTATGTGPSGATISTTTSISGTFSFSSLAVGSWTITVNGLDATSAVVASGSATVTVASNANTTASVALVPPAGNGTLSLSVTWPSGQAVDTVSGTITPSGGTASPISLTVSGTQATYTGTLASGSYVMILNIKNAGASVSSPRMDGVLIYSGKTSYGTYSLTAADFVYTAVTGLSLDKSSASLPQSASLNLNATISPATATTQTLLWQSDTPTVATVDPSGKVQAVAPGSAIITAATVDGGKTATCALTVTTSLTALNKSSTGLLVGGSEQLTPVLSSTAGAAPTLTWASSNTSILTVNATGLIAGVAAGFATVTASDGVNSKSCIVIVSASAVAVDSVTISPTATSLLAGQSIQFTAIPGPTDATNQTMTWASSAPTVATVSSSGLVTGVGAGTTTITVTTVDGAKTASGTVYISAAKWMVMPPAGNTSSSYFSTVVSDSSGNVYAGGAGGGNWGNGVTSQGSSLALVKYDSSGKAQWAFPSGYTNTGSGISDIALDSGGNTYAIFSYNAYWGQPYLGNGVVIPNGSNSASIPVLVKIDPSGKALWAQVVTGFGGSYITAVAVDPSGNVDIVGQIYGTGVYTLGNGIGVIGTSTSNNVFIAQFGPDGTAKWARSVTSGAGSSSFTSVTTDTAGNIYAAGTASGPLSMGSGITISGSGSCLVKYSSSGTVLMATVTTSGGGSAPSIALDSASNIYVINTGYNPNSFCSIVKCNSSGVQQWVRNVTGSYMMGVNIFNNLALTASGNIVVTGTVSAGTYDLGGISVVAAGQSLLYATYNASGIPQSAELLTGSTSLYQGNAVTVSPTGSIYVAGYLTQHGQKAMLLKY